MPRMFLPCLSATDIASQLQLLPTLSLPGLEVWLLLSAELEAAAAVICGRRARQLSALPTQVLSSSFSMLTARNHPAADGDSGELCLCCPALRTLLCANKEPASSCLSACWPVRCRRVQASFCLGCLPPLQTPWKCAWEPAAAACWPGGSRHVKMGGTPSRVEHSNL